jgi:hypothetical protein
LGTQDSSSAAKKPARAGRKYGTLRDHSQEYNTLARFLRDRMAEAGLTVADLVVPTGLKKSAISERLAGSAKLNPEFVDAVVVACTGAPELLRRRSRLRTDAATLLRTAQERSTPVPDLTRQPPAVRNTVVTAMEGASRAQEELLDVYRELRRKSDELEALTQIQYASQLTLHEATALSSHLSTLVIVLADEVERLTLERELTMTAQPPDLARLTQVDAKLTATVSRHDRTAMTLKRTEQDRRLATHLVAETITRIRRVRDEMRRLPALPNGGRSEPPTSSPIGAAPIASPLDDIDAALDLAEAVGHKIADRLRGALTALDPEAKTGPLPDTQSTDNADNAVTGADNKPRGILGLAGLPPTSAVALERDEQLHFLQEEGEHSGQVHELQEENQQLRNAIRSRPVIDQARGVLMATHSCTSDEAWFILLKASQLSATRLRLVAEAVTADAELDGPPLPPELRMALHRATRQLRPSPTS